jgi:hypothetical protein
MLAFVGNAGKDIEKACQGIYPLQNTFVRKVKVLRSPKFDVTKLMEVHGDYTEEVGAVSGLALHAPRGKSAALATLLCLHCILPYCWCQAGRARQWLCVRRTDMPSARQSVAKH